MGDDYIDEFEIEDMPESLDEDFDFSYGDDDYDYDLDMDDSSNWEF